MSGLMSKAALLHAWHHFWEALWTSNKTKLAEQSSIKWILVNISDSLSDSYGILMVFLLYRFLLSPACVLLGQQLATPSTRRLPETLPCWHVLGGKSQEGPGCVQCSVWLYLDGNYAPWQNIRNGKMREYDTVIHHHCSLDKTSKQAFFNDFLQFSVVQHGILTIKCEDTPGE